jgi:hypothetical protein
MLRQFFKPGEWAEIPLKVVEEVTDPVEIERHRRISEAFAKNVAWLDAHIDELLPRIRGKYIAIAGQELFVADTPEEACAWARATHPEDLAPLYQRIPAVRRDFIG